MGKGSLLFVVCRGCAGGKLSRLFQTKNEKYKCQSHVARSYCLCSQESCIDIAPIHEAPLSRAMQGAAETEGDPPAAQQSLQEPPATQGMQESEVMSQFYPYNAKLETQVADEPESKPRSRLWRIPELGGRSLPSARAQRR